MSSTSEESKRRAEATFDAVCASGKKYAFDIMAAVEAAETQAKAFREAAEQLIEENEKKTKDLATRIGTYIANCQAAMDDIQLHQLRIFEMMTDNDDDRVDEPQPQPQPQPIEETSPSTNGQGLPAAPRLSDFYDRLRELRENNPSAAR